MFKNNFCCKFRPLILEDLFKIKVWRNEQIKILRQNKELTDEDQKKYWNKIKNSDKEKLFAIEDEKNNLIGYCGLVNIHNDYKRAEISFLLKTSIKEGSKTYLLVLKKSVFFLINYSFATLSLNKLFIETFEFRKSHLGIFEEIGFKKEGILKEHVFKDNNFYTSFLHGLLKSEWSG